MVEHGNFIEIYCDSTIEECEGCDVKGLYKKARARQIPEFTGMLSPYDASKNPVLILNAGAAELDVCVQHVLGKMGQRGIIKSPAG